MTFSRNGFCTGFFIFNTAPRGVSAGLGAARGSSGTYSPDNPRGFDRDGARELELFVVNDGDLYRKITVNVIANLARKMKRGVYDHAKAPALYAYLIEAGAKKYNKEFGSPDVPWHETFNKATRDVVARELADRYREQVEFEAKR